MRQHRALFLTAALSLTAACATAPRGRPAADLVALDGALGNRFVASGQRGDVIARIRVRVPETASLQRPPINLALVVDTSGSMEGNAIEDARRASAALLDSLRDGDRLALVTFDSRAAVLVQSVVLDDEAREEVRRRIREMRAQGTTAMGEGLRLGVTQVMSHLDPRGINRVVLLGDGVPNDRAGIEELAASSGARGVSITALGLGLDYDETLMGAIAQRSGGRFHYVEDSSTVARVFRDEVLRMERVVGRNAVATLTPGPGVEVEGLVGVEGTRTDAGIVVNLGDITEASSRDLVVRLRTPSRRPGASVEVLDVAVAFDDAVGGAGRVERRTFLGARATASAEELASGRDEEVERVAARMQLAAGTLAVIRDARSGNVAQAQAALDGMLDAALARARARNDRDLEGRVSQLRRLREALPSVAPQAASAPAVSAETAAVVRSVHADSVEELEGSN